MSKSEDQKVQSKKRSRKSISRNHGKKSRTKSGQSRELTHKQEAKGHNLKANRSTRLMTKIKTKKRRRQASILHLTNIARSAFFASAGV